MKTICCELCTCNVVYGTMWKVKTTHGGKVNICDECYHDVRFATEFKVDYRETEPEKP